MDTSGELMQVLEADPELGEGLASVQLSAARRAVVAPIQRLGTGPWEFEANQVPAAGFLVVQGCLTREVVTLGETAAIEFLAEGDLLRPSGEAGWASVASRVIWQVLEPTRLARLDRDFLLTAQPWPEVTAQLLKRQERRAEWLANVLAISHLPRVDLRILVLFWQFADRWGKVRGGEVSVPIPLTHLNIARLIGARRPTVTTTLSKLTEAGLLVQESNGYWLLRGGPPQELRDLPDETAPVPPTGPGT
ncbi:MAG: Crp/Fnr family transcriptional regulator [Actinomycetota bacterium]|nr:Crp/Fnr family transcriptional regulator [Actinomycetota bacterium]